MVTSLALEFRIGDVPSVGSAFRTFLGFGAALLPDMAAFEAVLAVSVSYRGGFPFGWPYPEDVGTVRAFAYVVFVRGYLGQFIYREWLVRISRFFPAHLDFLIIRFA